MRAGGPRFRRAATAVWRNTGDGMVVLPRRGDDCTALSASARALWAALDEPRTAQEVSAVVGPAYGRRPEEIVDDVRHGLEQLEGRRVVQRDPLTSP